MKYSIDTSALISAYREHYPPDVFPPVWAFLDELVADGRLGASVEVLTELERKDDELRDWARARKLMFRPTDEAVQRHVSAILDAHKSLVDESSLGQPADAFVIALARHHQCTVVTSEKATGNLAKPHMPDVCRALGIPCVPLLGMFRGEGKTFP